MDTSNVKYDDEPREDDGLTSEQFNMESKMNSNTNTNGQTVNVRSRRNQVKYLQDQLMTNRHYQIHALFLVIIIILVIFLLFIGINMLVASFQTKDDICESSQCLRSSARIIANFNRSIDPCTNFYEFACNSWIQSNKLPVGQAYYSVDEDVNEKIFFDLRHFIDKIPPTTPSTDPHFKAKQFYQSCMSLDDIDFSSLNNFIHEIMKAGGWNIISNWHGQSWDQGLSLERLQILYGVNPYFKITVGNDDLNPQLPFIIKIYPSGLGLPSRDYYFNPAYKHVVEAYKQYMSETVNIFGGTKLDANQFAENTFNYEKRIAEITPSKEDYMLPANVFKRRFSIRELKLLAPSIKWANILQNYFVKARLNDNTRVLLAFEPYFRNISNIISTTDTKGLNDYLMWKMISSYAPYLSKEFRIIYKDFQLSLNGLPSSNSYNDNDRWKFCIETTNKFLGYSMSSLYVNNKLDQITNSSIALKANILDTLQNVILKNPNFFIWSKNEDSRKMINMKMKQMSILIGQPNFVLKTTLSEYYNEYIVGVKFLQNIIEAVSHKHKKMEMLLNEKKSDFAWDMLPIEVSLSYNYAANKLYIPAAVLQPPLYNPEELFVIQYGSMGFHIASQILKAFDLIGLNYGLPDGRLSPDRTFIDDVDLNRGLRCLRRNIESKSNPSTTKANITLSQTYIDLGALKIAWIAYKELQSKNPRFLLPSLNYDNDQLFFITFAQSMCSNVREESEWIYYGQRNKLPNSKRVNTLLSQSRTFSRVFKCKKPFESQACNLWN